MRRRDGIAFTLFITRIRDFDGLRPMHSKNSCVVGLIEGTRCKFEIASSLLSAVRISNRHLNWLSRAYPIRSLLMPIEKGEGRGKQLETSQGIALNGQNLLLSRILFGDLKNEMCTTAIWPVVPHENRTWCWKLTDEYEAGVGAPKGKFGRKERK
jgi:hypothetical protein